MAKLILEAATINESLDFNGKSIEELRKENPMVIRFIATLQTVNVKNRNGRYYPKNVLESGMNDPRIQDIMKRNNFYLEMGHPERPDMSRQSRVEETNAAGIIKKTWFEGNKLKGLIETTADPLGQAWKNRILYNGLIPAFSLRATGDFAYDNLLEANVVKNPIMIFSFDIVQYPSHDGAIFENLSESFTDSWAYDIPHLNNKYNTVSVFNEGMILEIPDIVNQPEISKDKRVHNISESYYKNVKKTHEYYAYGENDVVVFNEDATVTVEREHLVKVVDVNDYIKKDIAYNIYDFLKGNK